MSRLFSINQSAKKFNRERLNNILFCDLMQNANIASPLTILHNYWQDEDKDLGPAIQNPTIG